MNHAPDEQVLFQAANVSSQIDQYHHLDNRKEKSSEVRRLFALFRNSKSSGGVLAELPTLVMKDTPNHDGKGQQTDPEMSPAEQSGLVRSRHKGDVIGKDPSLAVDPCFDAIGARGKHGIRQLLTIDGQDGLPVPDQTE